MATTLSATHTTSRGPILLPPNSTMASAILSCTVKILVGTGTISYFLSILMCTSYQSLNFYSLYSKEYFLGIASLTTYTIKIKCYIHVHHVFQNGLHALSRSSKEMESHNQHSFFMSRKN